MTMPHLLEADQISKFYGNVVALSGISMHVNAGEVTCILGDNGPGSRASSRSSPGSTSPTRGG